MFDYFEAKFYIILCWIFFIFILIATPFSSVNSQRFTIYDKIIHFFMFGILAFLLNWGFRNLRKNREFLMDILVIVIVTGLVFGAEYLQSFVPTRTPAGWDAVAGIIGMFIGILFANSYLKEPK